MKISDRRCPKPLPPAKIQTIITTEIDPHTRIQTPWGEQVVESVIPAYTRRVEGRTIRYYKIKCYNSKTLITWEYTRWDLL